MTQTDLPKLDEQVRHIRELKSPDSERGAAG